MTHWKQHSVVHAESELQVRKRCFTSSNLVEIPAALAESGFIKHVM